MKKKRILLVDWNSQCQLDLQESLNGMPDCEIFLFAQPLRNMEADEKCKEELYQVIKEKEVNVCFSFNYLPVLSQACQESDVLYVCWVYDCPHTTLYSKSIYNSCNLIFLFDYLQTEELRQRGVSQTFHMPLAVNVQRMEKIIAHSDYAAMCQKYYSPLSFLGGIYDNNLYEQINYLPEHLKGYLDGICMSQVQVTGGEILEELFNEKIEDELKEYVKLSIGEHYDISYKQLFLELFLKKYVTSIERKQVLSLVSKYFKTALYSGSQWKCEGIECRGIVDYRTQMPQVFLHSDLNLNISLRSIQSGIPLRCIDIMGVGGTLLSNYQPELAEYFEMDKEWISFGCKEELLEKIDFYLSQEALRKDIARKGFEKVKSQFTYQHALAQIFQIVDSYL